MAGDTVAETIPQGREVGDPKVSRQGQRESNHTADGDADAEGDGE